MELSEIFSLLQKTIHSTIMATTDKDGLPVTCVIDLMLSDEKGLYFLTAKGKSFYERLMDRGYVSLSGLKGESTMTSVSVNLRGKVRCIGKDKLDEIFVRNPYMTDIYPTEASRQALVVFWIYQGEGEVFDLSQKPIFRQSFAFGGHAVKQSGYRILADKCIGCGKCVAVCPQNCIEGTKPRVINESHCLHCGNCLSVCPAGAVLKLEV